MRKPATERIEQNKDQEPDKIDARKAQADRRRARKGAGQGEPGGDGERVNQINVDDVKE